MEENEYIDYVGSWGPLILGHAHPEIIQALTAAARKGTSFGAPCADEVRLAEMIVQAIPSIEKVRMVNSGTEAAMSALRLARAFTGRDNVVKFQGCYHGHGDSFLIQAGSGLLTSGNVSSPGVPEDLAKHTLVARYNDRDSVEQIFRQHGHSIAALIIEPIPGNMGLVLPEPGFLLFLREITDQYGSLLIFDEVITGFRLQYGGYQNTVNIRPDLTILGKIIGGGLPVGAYGGRADIMGCVAPEGDVYQAGTLSGNPLAMAAGAATLELLQQSDFYHLIAVKTQDFIHKLAGIFSEQDIPVFIQSIGSMFCVFFTDKQINTYEDALHCDVNSFARFFRVLIEQKVYIPPSQFEVSFVSGAHRTEDLEETLKRIDRALTCIEKS